MTCLLNAAQTASNNEGVFGAVDLAEWESFLLPVAENAPEILKSAIQLLANQAIRNKVLLFMMAASIAIAAIDSGINPLNNPVGKYNVPASGVGTPFTQAGSGNQNGGCNGSTQKNQDSVCFAT
jgi:hypothetical protein